MLRRFSIYSIAFFISFFLNETLAQNLPASVPDVNTWVTDGPVYSMAQSSNTIYLGGNFNFVGPNTGAGALISVQNPKPNVNFPRVNGDVNAATSDGNGGWYIGGNFTKVGTFARSRVAHILQDGNVDPNWKPSVDTQVVAIIRHNGNVYIGGQFTKVNGIARNYLASVSEVTGALNAWNPNASDGVLTLEASGNSIYAGGLFSTIGGQLRNRVAELSVTNGLATSWNPNATGFFVSSIKRNGRKIYVGGQFLAIGGQSRNFAAEFDATTGLLTPWNPNPNGIVLTFSFRPGRVLIGGIYTNIGGANRGNISAIDSVTGQVLPWNPSCNNNVTTMQSVGDTVYVGGNFSEAGGEIRNFMAAFHANTGALTSWAPESNGTIVGMAKSGSQLYVGGQFRSVGMVRRFNAAAINISTGEATAWDPSPNDSVVIVKIKGNRVYLGGGFNFLSGIQRIRVASVDLYSGTVNGYNPSPNNELYALDFHGNNVVLAGKFSTIGGGNKNYLAMTDTNGVLSSWAPNPSQTVTSLAVRGNFVYAGGVFTSIGGQNRQGLAAINAITGNATSWNPGCEGEILSMQISNQLIYIGGSFIFTGGSGRNNIACIDLSTGLCTSWNPISTGPVFSIHKRGKTIYAAGAFASIGINNRFYAAGLDSATGQATQWSPTFETSSKNYGLFITTTNDKIWLGGRLPSIGSRLAKQYFASFELNEVNPVTITPSGSTILCAGDSVLLEASPGTSYLWLPGGQTSQTIKVKATGDYSVVVQKSNGSYGTANQIVNVNPVIPTNITVSGSTTFCFGDSVTLTCTQGERYLWSNGDTTQSIKIKQSGNYSAKVTQLNGCASEANQIVTVKPLPSAIIDSSGSLSFCQGGVVTLCAPDSLGLIYNWSNGIGTRCIDITQSGSYNIRTVLNGCSSAIRKPILVQVFPSPPKPLITASGPLSICQGECVTLSAPLGYDSVSWSNDETTASISVCQTVTMFLTVYKNGCSSPQSNGRTVVVNPLPPTPTPIPAGPTTFCNGDSVQVSGPSGFKYVWSNGDTSITTKIRQSNNLTLRVIVGKCTSLVSTPAIPILVKPSTAIITHPISDTICRNGSTQFSVSAIGNSLNYKWHLNGTPVPGNNQPVFSITNANFADTGKYFVEVTGECGIASSNFAYLRIPYFQRARLDTLSGSKPCTGDSVYLKPFNGIGGATFTWFRNDTLISGATQSYYYATKPGFYHFKQFRNGCGTEYYDTLWVRFRPEKRPRKPFITISPGLPVTCSSQFTLTTIPNSGNYTYVWSNDSGIVQAGISPNLITTKLGNYTVRIDSVQNASSACSNLSANFPVVFSGTQSIASPKINFVTVVRTIDDSLRNQITWSRPPVPSGSILKTIIYRQSNVANQYDSIGVYTNNSDTLATYTDIDNIANPRTRPWFYRIAARATCPSGGGSYLTPLSPSHKTIHLLIFGSPGSSAYNLIWNSYLGFPVTTYRIFRGATPNSQTFLTSVAGNINSFTDFPGTGVFWYSIEAETNEGYVPWGRINAIPRNVKSNDRPTTQGIPYDDSTGTSETVSTKVVSRQYPETSFLVFPNPHQQNFWISGGKEGLEYKARMRDMLGREMGVWKFIGNLKNECNIQVAKGIYWLEIEGQDFKGGVKVLKE